MNCLSLTILTAALAIIIPDEMNMKQYLYKNYR
jgi:hypothetical protein